MRRLAPVLALAAALAAPAAAAPPAQGVLVAGRSLGGVRLGDTRAAVRARFGSFFGLCRSCGEPTWYFTYRPFTQPGVAVAFRQGRVAAVYTIWSPAGWRSTSGLTLGTGVRTVPGLVKIACRGYTALVSRTPGVSTAYYVLDGKLWGFGLLRRSEEVCR